MGRFSRYRDVLGWCRIPCTIRDTDGGELSLVMRRRTLSNILLSSGAILGVVTTLGWMIGYDPTPLSPALVTIALYKLTYIAAGGMLVAGALSGRWARREEASQLARGTITDPASSARQLGEGHAVEDAVVEDLKRRAPSAVPERRER